MFRKKISQQKRVGRSPTALWTLQARRRHLRLCIFFSQERTCLSFQPRETRIPSYLQYEYVPSPFSTSTCMPNHYDWDWLSSTCTKESTYLQSFSPADQISKSFIWRFSWAILLSKAEDWITATSKTSPLSLGSRPILPCEKHKSLLSLKDLGLHSNTDYCKFWQKASTQTYWLFAGFSNLLVSNLWMPDLEKGAVQL